MRHNIHRREVPGHNKQATGIQMDKVSPSSIQKIMYQDWEHSIKRGFDGTKDQEWNVSVPYEASVKRMSSLIPSARSAEQKREIPIVAGNIVLKT